MMISIILGYLSAKFGFSCSSSNTETFIRGWFLGSGISAKTYSYIGCKFFKNDLQFFFTIKTRKDFTFGLKTHFYDCRKSVVFSFGYGLIGYHYY